MANRLSGKVAVITGGSSGIGAATARLFLQEGASVVLADLNEPSDKKLIDALKLAGDNRWGYIKTNVTIEKNVADAVALAVSKWGRLDITVACAGVPGQGSDISLTEEEWDSVFAINAKGTFFVTKHAVPQMIKSGGGSIINISSAYGVVGAPNYAAYCGSKGAVRTFTKSTAIEHALEGIRANSIHPGVTETPMLHKIFDEADDPAQARAQYTAQQPNGRNADPDDIAWGCVYLASDEARMVNGIELPIDGGLLAR